jgi:pimeloyl-ACP methyl ester carboxylesterase
MASDRLVLCPDTPGYGLSDTPASIPVIDDYAGALADALGGLGYGAGGKGPVDLLGFHTGNSIAIALAAARPDLVRRLVMPAIPYFPADERETMREQYAVPRPYFTDPDYLGNAYRASVFEAENGLTRLRRHELFVAAMMAGPESWYGFDAVFRHDIDAALSKITQPVLLPILNETLAQPTRTASELLNGPQVVELPDLDGYSWFLAPDALADVIRPFLDMPDAADEVPAVSAAAFAAPVVRSAGPGIEQRGYGDNRFGQMHVSVKGPEKSQQSPVVMFHQSPLSGRIFREQQAALATDRIVVCPDTPGFGDSDGPTSQPTMTDTGAAAAEALADLGYGPGGSGPVDLYGFHTGTFVAAEVAIQAPDLVRRVILCGVPYYAAAERQRMKGQFLSPYAFLTDPDYVDSMYRRMVSDGDDSITARRRLERFTDRMRSGPEGEWGPHAVFAYDADARLPLISQPLLLMAFDEPMTQPTRDARALLPDADYAELPALDMMGFMTAPDIVADAMREFLDA